MIVVYVMSTLTDCLPIVLRIIVVHSPDVSGQVALADHVLAMRTLLVRLVFALVTTLELEIWLWQG